MKTFPNLFRAEDKNISTEILALAFPVIMSNLSRTFMNLADVAMVGHLGAASLAATGMGAMLVWAILSFAISLRTATQTVASRRLGQKKFEECGVAMHNGHLLALVIGLPVSLAGYVYAHKLVPLFLEDTTVIHLCNEYTSIAFASVIFSMIGFVYQGFYTGVERTKIHMNVTITANMLNIYLNAGLIYGRDGVAQALESWNMGWLGNLWTLFPFPELGVKGAALATVSASVWMAAHYSFYLIKPEIRKRYHVFTFRFDRQMLWRQIKLALPQGSQEMIVMFGFSTFYKVVGMIGVIELAATQVVFTILHASFMPAMGFGQGCATLVGKYLGEKNPVYAEKSITEALRWSVIVMGSIGIIFLIVPHKILPVFTQDPEIISVGIIGLRILGLVQFVDAFGLTLWFALSGAGNTTYPALVESILVWGFFLPATYFFGVVFGAGFVGAWISFAVYIVLFALAMIRKIKLGDWKEIEV